MTNTLLTVQALSKSFGGVAAVSNVDFTVNQGEIYGIIGPNGAGKSTLLNLISGVLKPDTGSIVYKEQSLENIPNHEFASHGIARTFQLLRLFNNNGATVLDNVLLGAHLKFAPNVFNSLFLSGKIEREQRQKARDFLNFFGLSDFENETPKNLAFGQQRYVELARAMMLNPGLLLLDEPASGLNNSEVNEFADVLKRLRAEGITIVIIEHDMKLVMGLTDRILVLAQGKKLAEGTPKEIQSNSDVVEVYLGGPVEVTNNAQD